MTQEEVVGEVVAALERHSITYMVAGSFASNLHGVPRMTQDADLVVDVNVESALKLVKELQSAFYVSEDAAKEAVNLRRMFNAIHLATGLKIDLVVKKQRPFSDAELARSIPGNLGGRTVRFATAEDTVLAKLEWARAGHSERQYLDALGVLRVQAAAVDDAYLDRWADTLGVRELLERARRGEPFAS